MSNQLQPLSGYLVTTEEFTRDYCPLPDSLKVILFKLRSGYCFKGAPLDDLDVEGLTGLTLGKSTSLNRVLARYFVRSGDLWECPRLDSYISEQRSLFETEVKRAISKCKAGLKRAEQISRTPVASELRKPEDSKAISEIKETLKQLKAEIFLLRKDTEGRIGQHNVSRGASTTPAETPTEAQHNAEKTPENGQHNASRGASTAPAGTPAEAQHNAEKTSENGQHNASRGASTAPAETPAEAQHNAEKTPENGQHNASRGASTAPAETPAEAQHNVEETSENGQHNASRDASTTPAEVQQKLRQTAEKSESKFLKNEINQRVDARRKMNSASIAETENFASPRACAYAPATPAYARTRAQLIGRSADADKGLINKNLNKSESASESAEESKNLNSWNTRETDSISEAVRWLSGHGLNPATAASFECKNEKNAERMLALPSIVASLGAEAEEVLERCRQAKADKGDPFEHAVNFVVTSLERRFRQRQQQSEKSQKSSSASAPPKRFRDIDYREGIERLNPDGTFILKPRSERMP